jgi:hypothetical protein
VFFGGLAISKDEAVIKANCPHIVVGTPGRILALVKSKKLDLKNLKHFVLDECDKMLEQLGKFFFVFFVLGTRTVLLFRDMYPTLIEIWILVTRNPYRIIGSGSSNRTV